MQGNAIDITTEIRHLDGVVQARGMTAACSRDRRRRCASASPRAWTVVWTTCSRRIRELRLLSQYLPRRAVLRPPPALHPRRVERGGATGGGGAGRQRLARWPCSRFRSSLGMDHLYHWTDTAAAAHDPLLAGKVGFLNSSFFIIRLVIYFVIWGVMASFLHRTSIAQDASGDPCPDLADGETERSGHGALCPQPQFRRL